MRISATIFVILILTYLVNASVLDPVIENVVHLKASKPPPSVPGIWKKKTIWKPRWVKEWKSAKVMKPVWRKVWSPIQIREWMPIPKPPPGWDTNSTPLIPIHSKPQKPIKDSQGHGTYAVASKIPLWDPVPYPESQQPPPLPSPHHHCGASGCDSAPSQSFNHEQISEIIGDKYNAPDYYQNPEFSETVNHLTRLPPDGSWRPPQTLPDIRGLPEFLVPPKFQSVINPTMFENVPWTPLPPENKIKGHFITKTVDQPYKFQIPEVELRAKNNTITSPTQNIHPKPNSEYIQEAELVGEYHYSEFDLPNIKPVDTDVRLQPQPINTEAKFKALPSDTDVRFKPQTTDTDVRFKLQPIDTEVKFKPQPVHTGVGFKPLPSDTEVRFKPQPTDTDVRFKLQPTHTEIKFKPQPSNTETAFKPQPTDTEVKFKPQPAHPEVRQKPQQVQKSKTKQPETTTRVQKKHIPNQNLTNSFLPEVIFKEIYPNTRQQSSTKLQPVELNSNSTFPPNINPIFIPPNHRFSTLSETQKNTTLQIVYATTPTDYNQLTETALKSTTTEPYEIIFSSSLQATTERVTTSPIVIVTPENP